MKWHKEQVLLLIIDTFIVIGSWALTLVLKYDLHIPSIQLVFFEQHILIYTVIQMVIFMMFSLYNSIWAYASVEELLRAVAAVLVANFLTITYLTIEGSTLPLSYFLILILVEMFMIIFVRLLYRVLRRVKNYRKLLQHEDLKRVLIIGVGATASMIAKEMHERPLVYGKVIGFVDVHDHSIGQHVNGVKVLGNQFNIYGICKNFNVNEIIFALPSISNQAAREILMECSKCNCKVKTVPGIHEIVDGQVSIRHIRDIEIEDLLGRAPVNLDMTGVYSYIVNKVVMVTGGGGSIGSEICRQVSQLKPKQIIVLDNYENNAYDIVHEIKLDTHGEVDIIPLIATVQDAENMLRIFRKYRPNVVFHAAAHKHVPLMEQVPREAVLNNCFGTLNVAIAADQYNVERFVYISSDKAVNPVNVMGATKRISEMIVYGISHNSKTVFTAVRFGNVLGSNGSVVPLFKKQIEAGGPVTVTHEEVIRYFMTIPEAVQLVLQSGAYASGDDIFVLDMGEPVKIYSLAMNLIRLMGFEPGTEIPIEIVGLRPGEKLYEELLLEEEGLEKTANQKIYVGKIKSPEFTILLKSLGKIKKLAIDDKNKELKQAIKTLVPSYHFDENLSGTLIVPKDNVGIQHLKQ